MQQVITNCLLFNNLYSINLNLKMQYYIWEVFTYATLTYIFSLINFKALFGTFFFAAQMYQFMHGAFDLFTEYFITNMSIW